MPPANRPPANQDRPAGEVFLEELARVLWVALAIAVGVKAAVAPASNTVWPVFAAAGRNWSDDRPLYDPYPGLDRYRYSPTFAAAVAPLAALPDRVGGAAWGVLGVGLLFGGVRALYRDALPGRLGCRGRSAAMAVAAVGAAPMVWNLQSNAAVLGLVGYGAAAVAQGRWWAAAALLAAPAYVKVWPGAVAALLAGCWPRPLAGRLAVAAVALAAAPLLTAPPGAVAAAYREWGESLATTRAARWPGYRDVVTVWQAAAGTPMPRVVYMVVQAAGAVAVVAAVAAARRGYADRRPVVAVALGGWVCWQLLVGPGTEQNTYGLAAPVLGWWAAAGWQAGRGRWWAAGSLALAVLCSYGEAERAAAQLLPGADALLPLAVGGFAGWLAVYGRPVLRALTTPSPGQARSSQHPD